MLVLLHNVLEWRCLVKLSVECPAARWTNNRLDVGQQLAAAG